jgi:RNA polymerase sigma factor for flagellar operon FliA
MSTVPVAVEEYIPLVRSIAARFKRRLPLHVDLDDLIGDGMVGLMSASTRFDPERNKGFASFAYRRIHGEMVDVIRERSEWHRKSGRAIAAIEKARDTLRSRLCRQPESEEIAAELGWDVSELYEAFRMYSLGNTVSLEEPREDGGTVKDTIIDSETPSPEQSLQKQQLNDQLLANISALNEREQTVVKRHYFEDWTFLRIARSLNLCESRVSQIHAVAIRKLRAAMGARA